MFGFCFLIVLLLLLSAFRSADTDAGPTAVLLLLLVVSLLFPRWMTLLCDGSMRPVESRCDNLIFLNWGTKLATDVVLSFVSASEHRLMAEAAAAAAPAAAGGRAIWLFD